MRPLKPLSQDGKAIYFLRVVRDTQPSLGRTAHCRQTKASAMGTEVTQAAPLHPQRPALLFSPLPVSKHPVALVLLDGVFYLFLQHEQFQGRASAWEELRGMWLNCR